MEVPETLGWWGGVPGGAEWLERLPEIVRRCSDAWSLELERPLSARISYVAAVRLPGGTPAVLKVNFPEHETEHEADALEHWAGDGAVRLLARDDARSALLVERCEPGTTLWELEDEEEANRCAASVLRRLWRDPAAPGPFSPLAREAARWAEAIPERWERLGRPFERELVEDAVTFLREAGPSRRELVVVHQDLHGGNVLRSGRGWVAIDPKPLAGEREFDTASLLRDRRDQLAHDPQPGRRIRRRVDQLTTELDLDRERLVGWGVAHALAWGFGGGRWDPIMVACARWLRKAR